MYWPCIVFSCWVKDILGWMQITVSFSQRVPLLQQSSDSGPAPNSSESNQITHLLCTLPALYVRRGMVTLITAAPCGVHGKAQQCAKTEPGAVAFQHTASFHVFQPMDWSAGATIPCFATPNSPCNRTM